MIDLPKTQAEALAIGYPKYRDGVPCKRGHVSVRYADTEACVDCQTMRETVLVRVTVDVFGIEVVDRFNDYLLRKRLESPFGKRERATPMPKLRPKCQIALRAHPDDVVELTAYAESLLKSKAPK